MKRANYQYGTVELSLRSQGPAVWVYRWRENGPLGRRVRKSVVRGNTEKFKTKAQALRVAEGYRLKINRESGSKREVTFGALIERSYHASPIQQDYLRPAGEKARLARHWLAHFPTHLSLLA